MKRLMLSFVLAGMYSIAASGGDEPACKATGTGADSKPAAKPLGVTPSVPATDSSSTTGTQTDPAVSAASGTTAHHSSAAATTKVNNSPSTVKDTVGLVRGHDLPMGTVFPNIMGKPESKSGTAQKWERIKLTGPDSKLAAK